MAETPKPTFFENAIHKVLPGTALKMYKNRVSFMMASGAYEPTRAGNRPFENFTHDQLRRCGVLSRETARTLFKDYSFLRRVEHYLQILEDRQTHLLPQQKGEQGALAKRLFGPSADDTQLMETLSATRERTRQAFDEFIDRGTAGE